MAITATEARKNLFPLFEQVNNDRTPVEIMSCRGDAMLIVREDYETLEKPRTPYEPQRMLVGSSRAWLRRSRANDRNTR